MSTKANTGQTAAPAGAITPYIPWKTLEAYLRNLKKTTVPHSVDRTVKPSSMAGGTWGQLVSALRFLRLIDEQGATTGGLSNLVASLDTPKWKDAVARYILAAYADIQKGLSIGNATPGQLDARFKEQGKVQGQMLQKSIRFYLHAMREAGVEYSPLLVMRRDRTPGTRRKPVDPGTVPSRGKKEQGKTGDAAHGDDHEEVHRDTVRYPLFFKDKPNGALIVPKDLSPADLAVIESMMPVLKAYVGSGK